MPDFAVSVSTELDEVSAERSRPE